MRVCARDVMKPAAIISLRSIACGLAACCLLTFVSGKIENEILIAHLQHRQTYLHEGMTQCAILLTSVIITFLIVLNPLMQLFQQSRQKSLLKGIAATL